MYRVVKRVIDIFGSVFALVIFSPLILVIVVRINREDSGPILYKQVRVGQNGEKFQMLKFRSMVVGAHKMREQIADLNEADGPIFKIQNDPRVTMVGRWMRGHSFDEIPQFFNVLIGEMSLVGPRPALPEEVEKYTPREKSRLIVRPGLTGLWQVSGRSKLTYRQMIDLDLSYIETRGLFLDITILFKTVIQMFDPESNGAY